MWQAGLSLARAHEESAAACRSSQIFFPSVAASLVCRSACRSGVFGDAVSLSREQSARVTFMRGIAMCFRYLTVSCSRVFYL